MWVDFGHGGTCQIEVSIWPAMFGTSTGCSFRGPNGGDGSGWWQPPVARSESPGLAPFVWRPGMTSPRCRLRRNRGGVSSSHGPIRGDLSRACPRSVNQDGVSPATDFKRDMEGFFASHVSNSRSIICFYEINSKPSNHADHNLPSLPPSSPT